ncbi:hypothetical protein GDO81_027454 [Engystomops pustulosus]|uniref:Secreted protein n=1 Tax=Engystomops pustulosus TaxID=76066 RepID=A0AAV6YLT9_ENGPU|nr:hypothetical protein GDO81_027454 [Engystomops pustulosus]
MLLQILSLAKYLATPVAGEVGSPRLGLVLALQVHHDFQWWLLVITLVLVCGDGSRPDAALGEGCPTVCALVGYLTDVTLVTGEGHRQHHLLLRHIHGCQCLMVLLILGSAVDPLMRLVGASPGESLAAGGAAVGLLSGVGLHVCAEVVLHAEASATLAAAVGPLPGVGAEVLGQVLFLDEALPALVTAVGSFPCVDSLVFD